MRRFVWALGMCGFMAGGCIPVSNHHGADLRQLDSFRIVKNQTTERELVERFGPPATSTAEGDGTKHLIWTDTRSTGSINMARAFVPIPGLTDTHNGTSKTLMVTTRDGVVTDYLVTDSNTQLKI